MRIRACWLLVLVLVLGVLPSVPPPPPPPLGLEADSQACAVLLPGLPRAKARPPRTEPLSCRGPGSFWAPGAARPLGETEAPLLLPLLGFVAVVP